jgi:hypothetical protein
MIVCGHLSQLFGATVCGDQAVVGNTAHFDADFPLHHDNHDAAVAQPWAHLLFCCNMEKMTRCGYEVAIDIRTHHDTSLLLYHSDNSRPDMDLYTEALHEDCSNQVIAKMNTSYEAQFTQMGQDGTRWSNLENLD